MRKFNNLQDLQREIAALQKSSLKPVIVLTNGTNVTNDPAKPHSSESGERVDVYEEKVAALSNVLYATEFLFNNFILILPRNHPPPS